MERENKYIWKLIAGALSGQFCTHLVMTAGTVYYANGWAMNKLPEVGFIPPNTIPVLSAIIGLTAGYIIDGVLKHLLPYVVSVFCRKPDRKTAIERNKFFNLLVIVACGSALFLSTSLSLGVTEEISEDFVGEVNTDQIDAVALSGNETYSQELRILTEARNDARDRYNSLERNRKSEIRSEIAARSSQKNADLWYNGNGWIKTQIPRTISKATRKVDKAIAEAKADYARKDASLTAHIEEKGAIASNLTSTAEERKSAVIAANTAKIDKWNNKGKQVAILCMVMYICFTFVIIMIEEETGEDLSTRATVNNITAAMLKKAKSSVLRGIVRKAGLDKFTPTPTLAIAGVGAVRSGSEISQNSEKIRVRKSEVVAIPARTKSEPCKTGVCPPTAPRSEDEEEIGEGPIDWATPDDPIAWKKLTKKARGWSIQINEAKTESAITRNVERWQSFVEHARGCGYKAARDQENGRAYIVPLRAEEPEPGVYEWAVA